MNLYPPLDPNPCLDLPLESDYQLRQYQIIYDFKQNELRLVFFLHFELDPDPEMDSDLGVDLEPPWIRIQVTSIPALLDAIQPPAPDPQKVELLGCYFTK